MRLLVLKSSLSGIVKIPASKSHTIRAVAIASLAQGTSYIRNPLVSDDTLSSVSCYQALGAQVEANDPDFWKITGNNGEITAPTRIIDVGNSGTTLRLAAGSAALAKTPTEIQLTGDEQIQTRPIGPLLNSLSDLGAKCRSLRNNGKAPIAVAGTLQGGRTEIACLTSQYLSSLLLCTPLAQRDSEIIVTLLNEPDYVRITCDWLDKQNIVYENNNYKQIFVKGGQAFTNFDLPIPADFSSATFFMCAAAILRCKITLTGLDFSDSQPDKAVADYLQAMGAKVEKSDSFVSIEGANLNGIEIDMNKTPDALPAMAVVGAFAEGTTRLVNVPQARNKETDRIACMAQELAKMGAMVQELPDGLIIQHSKLNASHVNGYGDHRIVMALSLAGMALDGVTEIDTAEAINVTFPTYLDLMTSLGADMKLK